MGGKSMSINGETQQVINRRFREAQMMRLSGIGHWHGLGQQHCSTNEEECFGTDPLDLLEQELHYALENLNFMRLHTHQADEHGMCIHCRWDLNA